MEESNRKKSLEALSLAEEIIKNIEIDKMSTEDVCLKAARLAALLNDSDKSKQLKEISSDIIKLKTTIDTMKAASLIPNNLVKAREHISKLFEAIHNYKSDVHSYVSQLYYQLKFSAVPQEIFERTSARVDKMLSEIIPETIKKFLSIYDNLKSTNAEDWANAVHSCRRILKDLSDNLYPPATGISEVDKGEKKIRIGPENYINRLMIYVEKKSSSDKFRNIVGSHLKFLGDRLDAVYEATCKGSHEEITSIEEAERYIIYTYMLVGDILTLKTDND